MNKLFGKITAIESTEHMSLVDIDVDGDIFSSVVLETSTTTDHLTAGRRVILLFKETEVSIAKDLSGEISLRNRFKAVIENIERSQILSKVILDYQGKKIVSVISTRSTDRMGLKEGSVVEWLVKTNEVMILKNGE